jgi:hypothetical protein
MSNEAGIITFTSNEQPSKVSLDLVYSNKHKVCDDARVKASAYLVGEEKACNTAIDLAKMSTNKSNVGVGDNSYELTKKSGSVKIHDITLYVGYALVLLHAEGKTSEVSMIIANDDDKNGHMFNLGRSHFDVSLRTFEFGGAHAYQLNNQIKNSKTYKYVNLASEGTSKLEFPSDITHVRVIKICDIKSLNHSSCKEGFEAIEMNKRNRIKYAFLITVVIVLIYLYFSGFFNELFDSKQVVSLDVQSVNSSISN